MRKIISSLAIMVVTNTSVISTVACNNRPLNLESVLKNTDLGTFHESSPTVFPSISELRTHIRVQNDINVDKITFREEKSDSVIVKGDGNTYSGQVKVTYRIDSIVVTLDEVLTQTDLQIINTSGLVIPDDQQIRKSIYTKNPLVDVDALVISDITETSAKVTGDNEKYSGTVNVAYHVDKIVTLDQVLTQTDLQIINTSGLVIPDDQQIRKSIHTKNPLVDVNALVISDITETSAKVTGDNEKYSGAVNVVYYVNKIVELDQVLTQTDLQTINTSGLVKPDVKQIKEVIKTKNPLVDIDALVVSDITETSAKVTGDNEKYSGTVNVAYHVDKSQINLDFNYKYYQDYPVPAFSSTDTLNGDSKILLNNWTNYAPDWDTFIKAFPKLTFGDKSCCSIVCNTYVDKSFKGSQLSLNTGKITDTKTNFFALDYDYKGPFAGADVNMHSHLIFWHDDKNIYVSCGWTMYTFHCYREPQYLIDLENVVFHQ